MSSNPLERRPAPAVETESQFTEKEEKVIDYLVQALATEANNPEIRVKTSEIIKKRLQQIADVGRNMPEIQEVFTNLSLRQEVVDRFYAKYLDRGRSQ